MITTRNLTVSFAALATAATLWATAGAAVAQELFPGWKGELSSSALEPLP